MRDFAHAVLHFVDFHATDFWVSFQRLLSERVTAIVPLGTRIGFEGLPGLVSERFGDRVRICDKPGRVERFADAHAGTPNIFLLLESNPHRLSALLQEFIDRPAILFAPRTERFLCGRGLFVVTIPKAGTHLLFHLLNEFRLHAGVRFDGELAPHAWYFPLGNNSHVPSDTFVADIERLEAGGFHHPLFNTPTLLLYRNPLDILISEASYLGDTHNSAINHFLQGMPRHRRIDELIATPLLGLLGEFDDRILSFAPWLDLPNVIPISYEELVGPQGAGTRDAQLCVIWALQLKLHIPGAPTFFGEVAYFRGTPTFRHGTINDHKRYLLPRHRERITALNHEFMTRFGYDMADDFGDGYVPRHAERFRHRPLGFEVAPKLTPKVQAILPSDQEARSVYAFRGYLIGALQGCYYAIPRAIAPLNPILDRAIPHLHGAYSLDAIKTNVEMDPLDPKEEFVLLSDVVPSAIFDLEVPQLVVEGYKGYNIERRGDKFYTWRQGVNPADILQRGNTPTFSSVADAQAAIDR